MKELDYLRPELSKIFLGNNEYMAMKNFLFYVFKMLALTLVLMPLTEKVYSYAYLQSNKRSKISFIYNSPPTNYDVVILGPSISNNHFMTEMFIDKGLKIFNFGMRGSKIFESDLVLKLLLEKRNKIKNVIIDIDVILKSENKSDRTFLKFLPYFNEFHVIREHFKKLDDFNSFYYIPFYN